jgi:hypothetical protein
MLLSKGCLAEQEFVQEGVVHRLKLKLSVGVRSIGGGRRARRYTGLAGGYRGAVWHTD